MPTVHVMYGLAGSGKTSHARRLQAEHGAIRFTLDEFMIRLYPELSIEDAAYGERAQAVRALIWDLAGDALRLGVDVVLDWNFWSVERRAWVVRRAQEAGADVVLHWLTVDEVEATARAQGRAASGDGHFHEITAEGNAHLAGLMQPPSEREGLTIVWVRA